MTKPIRDAGIVQKRFLDKTDYDTIRTLQNLCEDADKISLKLELDYKLAEAKSRQNGDGSPDINEFLYRNGDGTLIGYLGICGFGGGSGTLELTGMVHPGERRKGVFKTLASLAMAECRRRKADTVLGLCDRQAAAGQALLNNQNASLDHSEYEMVLRNKTEQPHSSLLRGVTLRKAVNADAEEIARQDRIYFAEEFNRDEDDARDSSIRLPEEEEKRGFTIYLAVKDEQIIGKVNLQRNDEIGGIYGLGVVPRERGKGYGRAVLLLAVEKLREANAQTINLQVLTDNEKALRLYNSCGFETQSVMDYYRLR